jgi:xanthine dehydrogenase accessory factor
LYSEAAIPDLRRAPDTAFDGDGPEAAFALLADGTRRGLAGALITIVGTDGGTPRAPGSHMAVLVDGSYCGYVSGGCVEAAIAGEALKVLRTGNDAVLRFGLGSPFIDIRLPCGGGIDLHVHVNPAPLVIDGVLKALARREAFALELSPSAGTSELIPDAERRAGSGWENGVFRRRYRPRTRLVMIGQGPEFEATLRLARGADFELAAFSPDAHNLGFAADLGVPATQLIGTSDSPALPADPWTAIVFMFHDHERETVLLMQALESAAFYVGALGSHATHAIRCARLRDRGVGEAALARIHGPIGLFGPTRDATSLAVSVLAQIVEERRALMGP